MTFDQCFHLLLGHEGGFVDHPSRAKNCCDMFHGLPASKPKFYGVTTATKNRSPFSESLDFSSKFILFGCPEIVGLLCWRGPPHIPWFIPTVVVNSINGLSFRRVAHVFIKCLKAVQPLVAYLYATATPKMVSSIVRVVASIFHACPSRIGATFSEAMCSRNLADFFSVEAAAGSRITFPQLASAYNSFFPAITDAFPSRDRSPIGIDCIFSSTNNKQSSKPLACKINKGWHDEL